MRIEQFGNIIIHTIDSFLEKYALKLEKLKDLISRLSEIVPNFFQKLSGCKKIDLVGTI